MAASERRGGQGRIRKRTMITKTIFVGCVVAIALAGTAQGATAPSVTWRPAHSGNYTASGPRTINKVIIHTAEGSSLATWSWFQNPASRASAHYVVDFDGSIIQML